MFVTFYSYKGGVGRTLALANVAYLMATDKQWPCRVLLWDFDLEAPGLQQAFTCDWGDDPAGFVDCVDHWIATATLPDVKRYIHPTDVPGLDILPAGRITGDYTHKLEQISWTDLYENRRGFDFINHLRDQIAGLEGEDGRPRYDYVLIDSRTGYSDVGGICVRQLPDLVVLLFRPSAQNVAGIREAHDAIRAYAGEDGGRQIPVLPVVSPLWPFATVEAKEEMVRATEAFPNHELLSIAFEAALTYGDRVLAREESDFQPNLKVLADYRRLCDAVRGRNASDPRTLMKEAREALDDGSDERALLPLAHVLATNPAYEPAWGMLEYAARRETWARPSSRRGDPQPATTALDEIADRLPRTARAFVARARVLLAVSDWGKAYGQETALQYLDRALELDPDSAHAYETRAWCWYRGGDHAAALADARRVRGLRSGEDGAPASVVPLRAFWGDMRWVGAWSAFVLRRLEESLSWLDDPSAAEPEHFRYCVLSAHLLCAFGRREEALATLRELGDPADGGQRLDLSEALLVAGGTSAARKQLAVAAKGRDAGPADPKVRMLTAIADALDGDIAGGERTVAELLERTPRRRAGWRFACLEVFLETAAPRGDIAPEAAEAIGRWIAQLKPLWDPDADASG